MVFLKSNKMERLTIKEISPYLPYGLKWIFEGSDDIHEVMGIDTTDFGIHLFSPYGDYGKCRIYEGKPLLRPLSQLTEEIEHNGERFVPYDVLRDMELKDMRLHSDGCLTINHMNIQNCEYWRMEKLHEWHFDTANLLDRGLAVSIEGSEVEGE